MRCQVSSFRKLDGGDAGYGAEPVHSVAIDFIDERDSGAYHDDFDWIVGRPPTRSLDRMRTRYPQLSRGDATAEKCMVGEEIELLSMGGTAFIGIGQLHVLSPDGIPQQLLRRSVVSRSQA